MPRILSVSSTDKNVHIGYCSMGRMLLEKFSEAGKANCNELFISNRTILKIADARNL